MIGELEFRLSVPNLGRAVRFYSTLLDTAPRATERRVAWFDVPGSRLRVELREDAGASASSVRVCVEPARLQATAGRVRRARLRAAEDGLTDGGDARAITLIDPGGNRWELCTPVATRAARSRFAVRQVNPGGLLRRMLAAGPVESRFRDARAHDETLLLRDQRR